MNRCVEFAKTVARGVIRLKVRRQTYQGILVELTLGAYTVAVPDTVSLDAVSPEQTRSEWTVAFVASIVSLGVLCLRIINLSWLGCETSVAWGLRGAYVLEVYLVGGARAH